MGLNKMSKWLFKRDEEEYMNQFGLLLRDLRFAYSAPPSPLLTFHIVRLARKIMDDIQKALEKRFPDV